MQNSSSTDSLFKSAGLTSALQIIDVTSNIIYSIENTSSASPEALFPMFSEEEC